VVNGAVSRAACVRIALTRDEGANGRLSRALREQGLDPHPLPVTISAPLVDGGPLAEAATHLDRYDWVICASVRAVAALSEARGVRPWPSRLRSAAVGHATAHALVSMGATPPPVVAVESGADALLAHLTEPRSGWASSGQTSPRVLVLTVGGGRRTLIDGLRQSGAVVDDVEAYRMVYRAEHEIRAEWTKIDPQGLIVTSPSAGQGLVRALGAPAVVAARWIVAVGATTADALAPLGVAAAVSPRPEFEVVAAHMATLCAGDRGRFRRP
jgi:uroporphyrinogen-III synthase